VSKFARTEFRFPCFFPCTRENFCSSDSSIDVWLFLPTRSAGEVACNAGGAITCTKPPPPPSAVPLPHAARGGGSTGSSPAKRGRWRIAPEGADRVSLSLLFSLHQGKLSLFGLLHRRLAFPPRREAQGEVARSAGGAITRTKPPPPRSLSSGRPSAGPGGGPRIRCRYRPPRCAWRRIKPDPPLRSGGGGARAPEGADRLSTSLLFSLHQGKRFSFGAPPPGM
jgi:hypothetical protein